MLDVICSKQYRVATWICFIIELLLTGSGVDAIMVYSTRLLENLNKANNGEFPVSPILGTCLIGITLFVTSLISMFTLDRYGRKTLFMAG